MNEDTLQAIAMQVIKQPDLPAATKLHNRRFSVSSLGKACKADKRQNGGGGHMVKSLADKIVRSWNEPVEAKARRKFQAPVGGGRPPS